MGKSIGVVASAYGSRNFGTTKRPPKSFQTWVGERITPMSNGCWAWRGDLSRYGDIDSSFDGKRTHMLAHRYVYEVLVGPIPDDHDLHHECENPGCCNPNHLVPLTRGDHRRRHTEMRRVG